MDFIGTLTGFESIPKNLADWRKQAGTVVKPQKVYINRADRSPLGRYLEAYNPVDISLRTLSPFATPILLLIHVEISGSNLR